MKNLKLKISKPRQFTPWSRNVKDHNKRLMFRVFPKNQVECLQHATQTDNSPSNDSFHEAMSSVLVMAQLFSIMPVLNVTSKNPLDLYFSWTSFRTIYSLFIIILVFWFTLVTMHWSLQHNRLGYDQILPVIFYVTNMYVMIKFISIAQKWPMLMKQWQDAESMLPPRPSRHTSENRWKLAFRLKFITFLLMMLSIVEHILSTVADFYYIIKLSPCPSTGDLLKDYFLLCVQQLFLITEYSALKGLVARLIGLWCTFSWNYMNLFIILLSVGLTMRFRELNDQLLKIKGKFMPEEFWASQRLRYRQFARLCKTVDTTISQITIISFANNLSFVCVQLLKSLNQRKSTIHAVYFWFSLVYLIGRTLAVSLFCAEVFLESKKSIEVFRKVPKASWCVEVKRFNEEVTNGQVAFSGMRFFFLTRPLVLSVAGTIVTYELVLIQFQDQDENSAPAAC